MYDSLVGDLDHLDDTVASTTMLSNRRSSSASNPVLPLTEQDANNASSRRARSRSRSYSPTNIQLNSRRGSKRDGRKNKQGGGKMIGCCRLVIMILASGFMVVALQRYFFDKSIRHQETSPHNFNYIPQVDDVVQRKLEQPLAEFPSLQYALENSFLVGIYFAASWCNMSTPVTQLLDELFRDILVKPEGETNETGGLSIVYVSSDKTEEQFESYVKQNWMTVPYTSGAEERANLKRHFKTCAKREMEELSMETREREIPALIIISADTQQVLTYNGVEDIKEMGIKAIDHWLEMKRIAEGLDSKYVSTS